MKILGTGPVVGNGPQSRLILTVEDDEGHRFRIRLFADYAASLSVDQIRTVVRAILTHRHSPDPRYAELKGSEV